MHQMHRDLLVQIRSRLVPVRLLRLCLLLLLYLLPLPCPDYLTALPLLYLLLYLLMPWLSQRLDP